MFCHANLDKLSILPLMSNILVWSDTRNYAQKKISAFHFNLKFAASLVIKYSKTVMVLLIDGWIVSLKIPELVVSFLGNRTFGAISLQTQHLLFCTAWGISIPVIYCFKNHQSKRLSFLMVKPAYDITLVLKLINNLPSLNKGTHDCESVWMADLN